MSLEENKAVVRKAIEAINSQNLDSLDDLTAPDYFDHTHQLDLEGVKRFMALIFKAFPDWQETIEDIIAEGGKCVDSCKRHGDTYRRIPWTLSYWKEGNRYGC